MEFVTQIMVAVMVPEEGQDNSIESHMPGLVNLKALRDSENEIYFAKLKKHSELQTLYQLGGQAAAGVASPLPKQVIVGRRGFIYYIGPLLDDDQFSSLVTKHIRDTSFGIDNARHYKTLARASVPNKFEVNSIFRFCKTFEKQFTQEMQRLIEYKLQITERTTYFADESEDKEYECSLLFVSAADQAEQLGRLHRAVLDLEKAESVQVDLLWKSFADLPLLDEEHMDKLLPLGQDGKALAICSRCTVMIRPEELVGLCRQCDTPQLFCEKCTLWNRDAYQQFHNHYQRTQISDAKHCLMLVASLDTLASKQAVLRYSKVGNLLNQLYHEGARATEEGHFKERRFTDMTFNENCETCGIEIEFLMFICLGCRGRVLCEDCYFKQLKDKSIIDGAEHNYRHVFLRVYDYQNPAVKF